MNNPDTQFLRALGMILIFNSHLDAYYPIQHLGTGGAIGNSIFFCLSAFGIYLSQKNKSKPFREWIIHRLIRIYPSIWIVLLFIALPIMLIFGKVNDDSIMAFIGHFFNPRHWFIRALLIYYILSFGLLDDKQRTKLLQVFVSLSLCYFLIYFTCLDLSKWTVEDTSIKLIHYFMIFLFGIFLASKNQSITYSGIYNYLIPILLIVAIYVHKFLMSKGLYCEFQFIQQAAMYPLVFYLLKVSRSPLILSGLMRHKIISEPVTFISNHTLELYIIQETIHRTILKLNFPFPLNAITLIALTCILSIPVNKLANTLRTKIC
jgi:peptidoglycan/LPS O-acetylase OafA/YrhL